MFTGSEDHSISLDEASAMTKKYRDTMPAGSRKGGFFGRDGLESILAQEGCVGIRYYNGINTAGEPVIILVGADKYEDDLYNGTLLEFAIPCPTQCSSDNSLNK
jgi:hypothetical protein